jgi:hypothetical protein
MHMRINEAGENKFSLRVNHLCAGPRLDVTVYPRDGFVFAKNVSDVACAWGYDFSILYQQTHGCAF